MNRDAVLRFLAGAVLGALVAIAIGQIGFGASAPGLLPASSDLPRTDLPQLPATSTLQLVSYVKSAASAGGSGAAAASGRPQWWSEGIPRVPAITQFDGGPLANANCVMASGAMLARLVFGIVTTGSQLRALQDDQEGGTSLPDLETAVGRGWGVQFAGGVLSPVQLRALLFAGAGAEIVGLYGEIPVALRLQADFTAAHAIYLDGFREAGPEGPAAYYVIDPIGQPSLGYRGAWLPADVIERFGLALGFGGIASLWGFAGGVVPQPHPILPTADYPSASGRPASPSPSAQGSPGTSSRPGTSSSPGSTPAPGFDPMPTGPNGPLPSDDQGTTPPSGPTVQGASSSAAVGDLLALYARCTASPAPADCPPGLVAQVVGLPSPPSGSTAAHWPADLSFVKLRYVTPIGPNTYQIIFDAPADSNPSLFFWSNTGSQAVSSAPIDLALLGGQPVGVATVVVSNGSSFSFMASETSGTSPAVSAVGSVVTGK